MRMVTEFGQPSKVVRALTAAGVRHGQTVEATLTGVAVDPADIPGTVHARFCPMSLFGAAVSNVRILDHTIAPGPHSEIVRAEGEQVLTPFLGDTVAIDRVLIVSNGAVNLYFTHASPRRLNLPQPQYAGT